MKYIKQFALIALITFLGELLQAQNNTYAVGAFNILNHLSASAVIQAATEPASIYGMILLFVGLMTGLVKLPQIEETADLLLGVMPIFFISPTVSIMSSVGMIKDDLFGVLLTCIVSTIVVMAVTGWVAQLVMKRSEKEAKDDE